MKFHLMPALRALVATCAVVGALVIFALALELIGPYGTAAMASLVIASCIWYVFYRYYRERG